MNSKDELVWFAEPGENVRICLHGLDEGDIRKGYVLCEKTNVIPITDHILAHLNIINLGKNDVIAKGFKSVLHIHTVQEECEIEELKEIIILDH